MDRCPQLIDQRLKMVYYSIQTRQSIQGENETRNNPVRNDELEVVLYGERCRLLRQCNPGMTALQSILGNDFYWPALVTNRAR